MQGPSECRLRGQFERRKHQWKVFRHIRHIRQKQKNAILLCGRVKTVLNFSKTKIMEMYWSDRANNCRWGCVERQPIFRRVPCSMHVQRTKTSSCKHFADLFHSHIHLASDPDSVWPSAKLETSRNTAQALWFRFRLRLPNSALHEGGWWNCRLFAYQMTFKPLTQDQQRVSIRVSYLFVTHTMPCM